MIKPTIGRVVLVRPLGVDGPTWPGLVCHVWDDRLINVAGFNSNGEPFGITSITLLQDDDVVAADLPVCEWMPYQIGQAKKYETAGD